MHQLKRFFRHILFMQNPERVRKEAEIEIATTLIKAQAQDMKRQANINKNKASEIRELLDHVLGSV